MTLDKRKREQMLALCGEIREDDGVDPHQYFKRSTIRKNENRKAKQLCRQVAETLALVLTGETGDELLASLIVESVVPAPDSSRLLVTLHADLPPGQFDRVSLEGRLANSKGRLRCEVAAAITRRKTPVLVFDLVGPLAAKEEGR